MKNLTIAGTVNSSKLVEVNGKKFLEINVALNHVTPCEWIKVMSENTALTIEKGSRVSAYGNPEEKAYLNKQGNPAISRTLWASFTEVLYSPGKVTEQSETQPETQAPSAPATTPKQEQTQPVVQEEKNPLEIAIEKIDNAKSVKQCNFLYHDVVKTLVDDEERQIAISALNSRKNALNAQEKKAA